VLWTSPLASRAGTQDVPRDLGRGPHDQGREEHPADPLAGQVDLWLAYLAGRPLLAGPGTQWECKKILKTKTSVLNTALAR
jgi:hypothetical protein